jgi:hypothetical protein
VTIVDAIVALLVGIVLLVLAYQIPGLPRPVVVLMLVFGYILAIGGGLLLILLVAGVPIALGTPRG